MQAYWQHVLNLKDLSRLRLRCDLLSSERNYSAGEPLQKGTAELMAKSSLAPLEQTLTIDQLPISWLDICYNVFLDNHPAIKLVHVAHCSAVALAHIVSIAQKCPSLILRLYLLHRCMPNDFDRTLFNVFMVLLESDDVSIDSDDFEEMAISALTHDLGLLDIPPELTEASYDRSSVQFKPEIYFEHISHGVEFLNRIGRYSPRVIRAVAEHHENMDGTGHPRGLTGNRLSEFGQHIHFYDTLYSIFSRFYEPKGKTLGDLVPIVKMNAVTHFGRIADRVILLFQNLPKSESVFFKRHELPDVIHQALVMREFVDQSVEVIQVFTLNVGYRHEDRSLFALQNGFFHISLATSKSEIPNLAEFELLLNNASSLSGEELKRIEQSVFLLREIVFHVSKFSHQLELFYAACDRESVRVTTGETLASLSCLGLDFTRPKLRNS